MQYLLLAIPFIGALTHAVDLIVSKLVLTKEHAGYEDFCFYFFMLVFLLMFPFFQFFGGIPNQAFTATYLFCGLAVIVLAFVYNLVFYHGIKKEDMSEVENLYMFQGLFVLFFAFIIFSDERSLTTLIPAIIASFALIFSHVKKYHLKVSRMQIIFLLGVLMMAVEAIFLKKLLEIFNPYILYMTRCGILAVAFFIYKRPDVKKETSHFLLHMFTIAFTAAAALVLYYWT